MYISSFRDSVAEVRFLEERNCSFLDHVSQNCSILDHFSQNCSVLDHVSQNCSILDHVSQNCSIFCPYCPNSAIVFATLLKVSGLRDHGVLAVYSIK